MIHYNRIENALTSLNDATDRGISLRDDTFNFSGLNSEYVSHQSCVHEPGHHVPQCVVFENSRYMLIVAASSSFAKFNPPMPEYQQPYSGPWRQIPAHLIQDLFKFPATAPKWATDSSWAIYAMVPDFFHSFDEDGKPVFRPDCKITALVPDGEGNENLRVLFNEDNSEAVDPATELRLFSGRIWKDGDPLSQNRVTCVGKIEPSDEFDEIIPETLGNFLQCKRWDGDGDICNLPAEYDCPPDCPGKTNDWFWHPASEVNREL